MGIHISKHFRIPSCCKNSHFQCFGKKEYITEKSLHAVREIIVALRSNVQIISHGWMFRAGAALNQTAVQELNAALEKGDVAKVRSMLESGWRLEASQALYTYLTRMEEPLIPLSIQSLVLGDENENVDVEIIVADVLGLMKEELPANQLLLAAMLFELLDAVIKSSPADELRGNTLPISLLPLFFTVQTQHINEWRRIVTVFVEMIRQAPVQLQANAEPADDDVRLMIEAPSLNALDAAPVLEERELLQNVVVRRYLEPVGHRGDCSNLEVIERRSGNGAE
ncbi:unnamed protein product [Phyllotreta striolata]|uniref:Rho-GAP domain-containing protein n=1 Tax=Phyllotreta striolata TaxID=444603 RepID=A0A9P0DSW1_PHYSR|nr:unnamed protein product [Phyllotreta striolata]